MSFSKNVVAGVTLAMSLANILAQQSTPPPTRAVYVNDDVNAYGSAPSKQDLIILLSVVGMVVISVVGVCVYCSNRGNTSGFFRNNDTGPRRVFPVESLSSERESLPNL